jgi:thioredoxin:protein disulfide reductase
VLFVLMAMSLFGAFELQVPTGVASRLNRVQGSGYPGAFVVGLVAGIVASPCIGPVLVGMLAYVAATGSAAMGFTLFFTFALGLGVLFVVLGTFTGVITSLPKSGDWMRWVRIVFGVLLLAVALYYVHPLLPHERRLLPLGLALVALGLGLGALRRIEETEPATRRWRKSLARVALGAGVYAAAVPFLTTSHSEIAGPRWLASETEGRTLARTEGKPMMVDFRADWCVACKELEHDTFSDPRVIELAQNFVTVRVDATDRTAEIRDLEETYGIIGLPWVAFVSPEGTVLADLTVTGFIDAEAMLDRMHRALPGGAASATAAGTTP